MTQPITPVPLETRQQMLQTMLAIRQAEDEIQGLFLANLVRGTTHLAVGQEACAVGTAAALQPGDTVTCTYRGHHHALALGMPIKALMAEMMGKVSGACKGKGGSMHMTDASVGLLGANAIVGGQIPIAVGAGLTAQLKKTGAVSVTFFGDGTVNIGAFHEAMNMAAIWKLPVLFICENNQYGEYSAVHKTTPLTDLVQRAVAYNMPSQIVDGQDAEAVYQAVSEAAARARAGQGPTFIELKTYRYRGHSRTDTGPYRPEGELEEWLKRDPIDILKNRMIDDQQLDADEFAEMRSAAQHEVHEALAWAKDEPFPTLEELYTDIYYEG
ncbi:MAG: thiamine pyrophosphate-dependent dehydrogenase E1 component subunit alpha [Anaerolineae bacterium]|nr:thiamine pyrophosphate-dependent dehydrogenase E1 component subunit alpha [Anaerolineae bacterium]MCA9891776.1 thiamine pyrophosphate-dependent dehydrogenase E1 component subunit alpha [Anaerolineae bacterium]